MSTTAITPRALVAAPGRLPLPYGLFSVVNLREGSADRWESGVTWESLPCAPAEGRGNDNCDPVAVPVVGLPKVFDVGNETQNADPFTVYGTFKCAPVGWPGDTAQARATAHLLTREEARVEQAVWTGDLGNAPSLHEDAVILGGAGPTTITVAIARLEDFIATNYGSLGTIHMTRATATVALADKVIESRGGRLYTLLGTPVVAGAGYPGSGPDNTMPAANQAYVYGTPAVFGYRSDVFTSSNVQGDLLDRGTNDLYAVAERSYLLGWDDCGVGAVLVGLPAAPPADEPPPVTPTLTLTIGTVPGSPVSAGTDVTVEVHTNQAPVADVHLWARVDAGPWQDLGEMTELLTTEFVFNQPNTVEGTYDLYAAADGEVSSTITLEVTA